VSPFSDLTMKQEISFASHLHSFQKQPKTYNMITYPGASILIQGYHILYTEVAVLDTVSSLRFRQVVLKL